MLLDWAATPPPASAPSSARTSATTIGAISAAGVAGAGAGGGANGLDSVRVSLSQAMSKYDSSAPPLIEAHSPDTVATLDQARG